MATANSVKSKLLSLISTCQEVTGIRVDDLTIQVKALISMVSTGPGGGTNPDEPKTTATYDEATGDLDIVRYGEIATMYDEETGNLSILNDAATYNEKTGELTI